MLWRSGDTLGAAIRVPAAAVRRRLRAALDRALGRRPRGAQAFLDLFAGTGRVGKWMEKLSGLPSVRLDVKADPAFDLTSEAALKMVRGWIASRVVRAVWLAPPCSTWSVASRNTFRTPVFIDGKPNLSEKNAIKVQFGNATALFTVCVVRACLIAGIPVAMENPQSSLLWQCPAVRVLTSLDSCKEFVTHMCQHGLAWKKPTKVVGWNVGVPPQALCKKCSGVQGICCRTGRPHVALQGRGPGDPRNLTARAEEYPNSFARGAASLLVQAADQIQLGHLTSLAF